MNHHDQQRPIAGCRVVQSEEDGVAVLAGPRHVCSCQFFLEFGGILKYRDLMMGPVTFGCPKKRMLTGTKEATVHHTFLI